jgi:hypothetical protein
LILPKIDALPLFGCRRVNYVNADGPPDAYRPIPPRRYGDAGARTHRPLDRCLYMKAAGTMQVKRL